MTPLEIHPAAQRELVETIDHYLGIDAELGDAFESTYLKYRDQIRQTPLLYNIRRANVRRVNLLPRFGEFHIACMIWDEKVIILAIAHAKRKPYYWQERIEESKKLF
jgi:hypothetical protein